MTVLGLVGLLVGLLVVVHVHAAAPAAQNPIAEGPTAGNANACPAWQPAAKTGQVERGEIHEASGLAAGVRNEGLLWTHNDSGDVPRVFALLPTGQVLASYRLRGAKAWDWEDIAVGGDGHGGGPYIYAGDIGDNRSVRPYVVVYRVEEPAVSANATLQDLEGTVSFELVYPDGPHDAETLLVDWRSGDLFIVTKDFGAGVSGIYRSAYPHDAESRRTLEAVGRIRFPGTRARDVAATGGDTNADGDRILIRTYTRAYTWSRRDGESLADALLTVPCPVPTVGFGLPVDQYESIAFSHDGGAYYTLSEGSRSSIYRFDARSNANASTNAEKR